MAALRAARDRLSLEVIETTLVGKAVHDDLLFFNMKNHR
jgi:hypothetical protein